MEETFFLNVDINKTDTHLESKTKIRIWPALLSFNNWVMKSRIPGMVSDGAGIALLTNCAIVVEGLITDLMTDYIKELPENQRPVFNADHATWRRKKPLYNELFAKPLEAFPSFQTVEVLITFRNNLAHGRSHDEVVKTNNVTGTKGNVESENNSYQTIRQFLIDKKLLQVKDIPSNCDYLWKYQVAWILSSEVKSFLAQVVKEHDKPYAMGIKAELAYALLNSGN